MLNITYVHMYLFEHSRFDKSLQTSVYERHNYAQILPKSNQTPLEGYTILQKALNST